MPVGVGAAIATGLGLVGGAGGLTFAGGLVATGVNAALFLGLAQASSAIAQRELKNQGIAPRDVIVRGGDFPKVVVYGKAAVGGVLAYMNQRDVGNDDFELWAAIVHAGHECNNILGVYYEDSYIDYATDLNGSGDLTDTNSPWYAVATSPDPDIYAARLFRYLGTSTQTVNTELQAAFADITTNFRLRGYPYTLHRWYRWQGSEEVFKGGEPNNIRALMEGRIIYDPRLDTSPGANPDNLTYWAYSDNPILCAVDYMRTYMGVAASRFDWTHIDAQADKCDVTVSTPAGNQNRYTCNGAISLGDTHDDNLAKILATCLGFRTTVNGLIRFTVGDDQTPDVTLDETDIIGRVKVRTALPREDRYNRVAGTYIAADAKYASTEFQPVEESNFVTRDNGETINKRIALDMVTDEYQAQRIAYKLLQQSDQQVVAEVPLRWSGLRLTPGTYVQLTYDKFGWSNKVFRCESLKIGERGIPVTAVLREDSASAWDDPLSGDYTQISPDGEITKPPESVPAPTNTAANGYALKDLQGILVTWTNPSDSNTWDWVNVYASPDSSWANAVRIATRVTSEAFWHDGTNAADAIDESDTRYYWTRAVRNGVESLRDPNSDTSSVTATAGEQIDLANDALIGEILGGSLFGNAGFGLAKSGGTYGRPDRWWTVGVGALPSFTYQDASRDLVVLNSAAGGGSLISEMFPVKAGDILRFRVLGKADSATSLTFQLNWHTAPPAQGKQTFTQDSANVGLPDLNDVSTGFGSQTSLGTQSFTTSFAEVTDTVTVPATATWATFQIDIPSALIVTLDWAFGVNESGVTSYADLDDTEITSPANASLGVYETSSGKWKDRVLSGDATMSDAGVVTVADNSHNHTSLQNSSGQTVLSTSLTGHGVRDGSGSNPRLQWESSGAAILAWMEVNNDGDLSVNDGTEKIVFDTPFGSPKPGAFRSTTAVNITNTEATIAWNQELFDPDGNYSNASGEITISEGGYYFVAVDIPIDVDDTTGATDGTVYINIERDLATSTWSDTPVAGRGYVNENAGAGGVCCAGIFEVSDGEAIRVRAVCSSTTNISGTANRCSINIFRVRVS